jgi:hypothetical protein
LEVSGRCRPERDEGEESTPDVFIGQTFDDLLEEWGNGIDGEIGRHSQRTETSKVDAEKSPDRSRKACIEPPGGFAMRGKGRALVLGRLGHVTKSVTQL